MSWTPGLDLETLRPGQRKRGVGLLKRRLTKVLVRKGTTAKQRAGDLALVALLNVASTYFNRRTRTAVMVFQKRNGLPVDGVVGRRTWLALGFKESDLMPLQLRGIPFPPDGGVRPMDGNWVALPLWNILAAARKVGAWLGTVNSGWRPDWYQKVLFDRAVARYGSIQAASKWVAPPGVSKHRFKDARGAVDVEKPEALLKRGLYRPMSWEPWHLQIRLMAGALRRMSGRGVHPELVEEDEQSPQTEVPPSVDMDMLLAYIDSELDECELRQQARASE